MKKQPKRESTIIINGDPHSYTIRKSKKARNLLLHVHVTGEIEAVLPQGVSYRQAEAFVSQRTDWLERMLAKYKQLHPVAPKREWRTGDTLPYFGLSYELVLDIDTGRKRRSVREQDGVVTVRADGTEHVSDLLMKWYRKQAREYYIGQAIAYAAVLNKRVRSVKVLNTKSQWGSCNRETGALTFQWRLALGPEAVAQYVVVHEVAHLVHPNHSKAFWDCVEKLMPGHAKHRQWLRKFGHTLVL